MRCSYKPAANSLWSIWYCLLTVIVTVYLLYLGVRRYAAFNEDDWHGSHAEVYSVVSIILHGLVAVLIPFFIAASCFKVGNLASDGDRLGDRTRKVVDVLAGTAVCRKLKSAWQHGPPVAQTIHLSMAFALLMAHTLMETQFFKHHGSTVLQTEEIWSTDLEFLYRSQDDKLTQLIRTNAKDGNAEFDHRQHLSSALANSYGAGEHGSMDGDRSVSRYLDSRFDSDGYVGAVSSLDVPPKLLPFLSNFRLYGMSLLFINYVVALLIYASAYPSVFWRASVPFSFLFSCHLLLHAAASIFAFIGFVTLYRYQVINDNTRPPFILNEYLLLTVYISSCAIFFFASSVVYGYGYNKFYLRLLTIVAGGRGRLLRLRGNKTHPVCCEGYSPHIAAILMLILMVAAKAPLLYDQMILYQKYFKPITLVCIISDVVYLFAWILLWLGLTLKRDWAFKVRYSNAEIGALLGLQTEEGRAVTDTTLMVICGDDYFATDDESKRTAILQLAEKCGLGQHEEEVYWLKPSHTSGNADGQPNVGSPEMNNLIERPNGGIGGQRNPYQQLHHPHPAPHTKAATIGSSSGSYWKRYGVGANNNGAPNPSTLGYSKVSFSDGEHDGMNYLQKQQQQKFGQTRASGSYVRFSDDQSAIGLNYDDHAAQDIVSTFGTLPRQDYPRRRIIRDNENEFFAPPSKPYQYQQSTQVQTVANVGPLKRAPSPSSHPPQPDARSSDIADQVASGLITYASVHKRNGSPSLRTAEYGRIIQQPQQSIIPSIGDTSTDSQNVSRVSSYANIPASSKQGWDAASNKMDAARPPTGRPIPHVGNGNQQQQFHHHQHHYNVVGSNTNSPQQPYGSLPHPTSITNPINTPNGSQARRQQILYKPATNSETVALQPRASPKHSPSLESDGYSNGLRKLTSFSNSSASGGAGGGESNDTTPTQQSFGGLLTPNPLTTSASSSSREMTPISNASGSLSRPPASGVQGNGQQQQINSSWHTNPVYGQPNATPAGARAQTPQSNYGNAPAKSTSVNGQQNSNQNRRYQSYNPNGGLVYYNGSHNRGAASQRPATSGGPVDALGATATSSSGGRTLLGLEPNDRNDSANFSLTSSNESDNNQFVTSIV